MRALQALVAFLGILIIAGLGLVVIAMMQGPKSGVPKPIAVAAAPSPFALPSGYRVAEMVATADRLILRLESQDGRQRLVILDPGSGLVTRTLDTAGAP